MESRRTIYMDHSATTPVRDEVFATKDYDGMLGAKWSFDAAGDTTLSTMSGQKVQNGEFVFISALK